MHLRSMEFLNQFINTYKQALSSRRPKSVTSTRHSKMSNVGGGTVDPALDKMKSDAEESKK
jgi:hypothetical protein